MTLLSESTSPGGQTGRGGAPEEELLNEDREAKERSQGDLMERRHEGSG